MLGIIKGVCKVCGKSACCGMNVCCGLCLPVYVVVSVCENHGSECQSSGLVSGLGSMSLCSVVRFGVVG